MNFGSKNIWGILRILLGWTFFWAFLDKIYGLGFATKAGQGWIDGISPTSGFLKFVTKGPLAEIFQSLAGNALIDWLFMLGLLLIGLALTLGIGMKIATHSGALLMLLMYLAVLPPEHNPLTDEHIIYIFLLLGLYQVEAGKYYGFGCSWQKLELVKKYPILK